MKHRVLYRGAPAWEVGANTPDVILGSHYPDDYAGRVAAVLPYDSLVHHGGAEEVVLDLTDEEASALAGRTSKLVGGRAVPVTFDDRWGAAKTALLAKLGGDVYGMEQDEPEDGPTEFEREAVKAVAALPTMKAHTGTGLYAAKKVPNHNDDTQSGAAVDHGGSFTITLTAAGLGTADLWKGGYVTNATEAETAAIISHTGSTVTLEEHAGITIANWTNGDDLDIYDAWGTIQLALDQLFIDQGAAVFDATQEVRVYAGTYNESVQPAGFAPRSRYRLLLKINTGDSVTISCAGVANAIVTVVAVSFVTVDGFTISGTTTGATAPIDSHFNSALWQIKNCTITAISGASTGDGVSMLRRIYGGITFEDCEIDGSAGAAVLGTRFGLRQTKFLSCDIHDFTSHLLRGGIYPVEFEGCTIHDMLYLIRPFTTGYHGPLRITNCTIYSITGLLYQNIAQGRDWLVLRNNIFHTIGSLFTEVQSYELFDSGPTDIDRNDYYNVTKWLTSVTETDITTFAAWQARGYDAAGLNVDPLLTDPANDDFSLAVDSPCRRAAAGAGVDTDVDGVAFDPYHPDMGGVSGETSQGTATWPASLPQTVDQSSYVESLAEVVARSDMDSGPAKVRRRFTAGVQRFAATIIVSVAQAATLDTFFTTTCEGGAVDFTWTHPRTAASVRMRFVSPPQISHVGPGDFRASLDLEILP